MQAALEQPLDIDALRKASQRYLMPAPSAGLAGGATELGVRCRCLASRAASLATTLSCWWNDPLAADELMATLELGYLLNLTQHDRDFAERMQYISRSGFFTSTLPLRDESQVITHYSPSPQRSVVYPPEPSEIIRGRGVYLANLS